MTLNKKINLLVSLMMLVVFVPLHAAKEKNKPVAEVTGTTSVALEQKTAKSPSAIVEKNSPVIEFVPQLSVPVGYLAQVYKAGGGFRLGFHFKLPLPSKGGQKLPLEVRLGFQYGMGFYPSYRGLVLTVPMYPELTLLFPVGVASPYLRIGGGLTVSSYLPSKEVATSYSTAELKRVSADGILAVSFGSYFNPPQAKMISVLLEFQFLSAIEKNSGMFLNFGFGVAYHFDGSAY